MERAVTQLSPASPEPVSRQDVPWNAPGRLAAARELDGRFPLFSGGFIFEVWAAMKTPSPVDITIILWLYRVSNPATPLVIGTWVLPAGQIKRRWDTNLQVQAGQDIGFSLTLASDPGSNPGTGLTVIARRS